MNDNTPLSATERLAAWLGDRLVRLSARCQAAARALYAWSKAHYARRVLRAPRQRRWLAWAVYALAGWAAVAAVVALTWWAS